MPATLLNEERVAFVFPGQGSQYVGMGKHLYEASQAARTVFEKADETLGFCLSKLMFEGPGEELEDTINAQPAVLTFSVACLAALRERWQELGRVVSPLYVAGHSLGEYTALVAAGVLDFSDALRLVRERGRLMKETGQTRPGGMAAVVGLDRETLEQICQEARLHGVIVLANSNSPEQMVVSGELPALDVAVQLAREQGAKAVVPLRISIASHSPLMQQAAIQLAELIAALSMRDPVTPVVANIQGRILTTAEEIRDHLADQLCRPVEWTRSVREMIESGVDTFVEIGPGQVLSRLITRISRDVRALTVGDSEIDRL
ncbi:MAG TPA: ACP S-malonyltransferase [Chloroflexota bacterium]|nr:ACP S-malonyltransferase [Chloroflexota bacterium]